MRKTILALASIATLIPLVSSAQDKKPCGPAPWPAPEEWQQAVKTESGWGHRDIKAVATARTVYFRWDDSIPEIDRALPRWARERWTEACPEDADLTIFIRQTVVVESHAGVSYTFGVPMGTTYGVPELRYVLLGYDHSGRLVHYHDSETIDWVWGLFQKMFKDADKQVKKEMQKR